MESIEEDFYGSSDHQHTTFTTKGRRTKRQRTATSVHGGGSGGSGCLDNSDGSSASATPSITDERDVMSEVNTEEEDMANCLILLAQGVEKKRRSNNNKFKISSNNNNNSNNTITSGVVFGVYECKTCNRTFPSFQALGGHRTSHKKEKPNTVAIQPIMATTPTRATTTIGSFQIEDRDLRDGDPDRDLVIVVDDVDGGSHDSSPLPSSIDTNTTTTNNNNNNNSKSNNNSSSNAKMRMHECSICGSEFQSGQALGGHMRRHRPIPTVVPPDEHHPIITASTSTAVIDSGGPRNILALDLNLPAPNHDEVAGNEDSHMIETKFHGLPTPALVDCHY